ncbi:hypothetical protein [Dysosmobacter sp.]|jgi:hypothetical protein|uniref:hypothetical protein n=1 Tax=Dysosmobacter sp. TaxID=2591382 RepID=UPI003AF07450
MVKTSSFCALVGGLYSTELGRHSAMIAGVEGVFHISECGENAGFELGRKIVFPIEKLDCDTFAPIVHGVGNGAGVATVLVQLVYQLSGVCKRGVPIGQSHIHFWPFCPLPWAAGFTWGRVALSGAAR